MTIVRRLSPRLALGVAAVSPFVLSLIVAGRPIAAAAIAPAMSADRRPATLAFEQYLVNLGPVPAVREVSARFGFRNVGPRPLIIRELQPSCGCLNPRLEKREYGPGESGAFPLRVQTTGQNSGPVEFTIRVKYDELAENGAATERPPVDLSFKVILPEKQVSIHPRALAFYQLGSEPTSQDVAVLDSRGRDLEIVDIVASSPLIRAERAGTQTNGNTVEHKIRVTVAADVPLGRTRALVTLRTNDPAYRTLQIPILIQGPESRSLAGKNRPTIEPAQLNFPGTAGLLAAPQEVTITTPPGEKLDVLAAVSSTGAVAASFVESRVDETGRTVVRLSVQLATLPAGSPTRDAISLRTADLNRPPLQIPVFIGGAIQKTAATSP